MTHRVVSRVIRASFLLFICALLLPPVQDAVAAGVQPTGLRVDTSGNGVFEPDETASVRPTWRNETGASAAFTGALSNFTGPAGPTYAIDDPSGDYGTVADGDTRECSDCYAVSITLGGTRPALHWDVTVQETLSSSLGVKTWTLHVGNSFPDAAPSNPFYRFIETLLHNGVTAGCGGGLYCPSESTTREQMSIFLLKAKEGAAFLPPACSTPPFTDVPTSSIYCRFIDEIADRGITAGCGDGRYCPGDSVLREQMAIFVLKTQDPGFVPPACVGGATIFEDVPSSSPYCPYIEELFRRGVVSGCSASPRMYCPRGAVTRQEMAVFLTNMFGLTLYGP